MQSILSELTDSIYSTMTGLTADELWQTVLLHPCGMSSWSVCTAQQSLATVPPVLLLHCSGSQGHMN